jgi:hypothetical protein
MLEVYRRPALLANIRLGLERLVRSKRSEAVGDEEKF